MKKFALILVLALSLTFVFAACSGTEKTNAFPRWDDDTYTFNISKALLSENLDVTMDGKTFYAEPTTSGYEQFENLDEVEPNDIGGTYTMTIKTEGDYCNFKTEQIMYSQYETEYLQGLSIWTDLKQFDVTDSEENPFASNDGFTTLKSTTIQNVTFENVESQRPQHSETTVNGFYLGNAHQEISQSNVKTEYDWDNNVANVTVNGTTSENKLKVSSSYKFIDSNQILLYVRSLEKASTKFQDTPGVQVYVPAENVVKTVTFGFTYSVNAILKVGGEDVCVTVNAVAVIIDSHALLVQLNVPDSVNKDVGLDVYEDGAVKLDNFTTLRFRAGFIRYELADYTELDNGAEIIDAIKHKTETSEEE